MVRENSKKTLMFVTPVVLILLLSVVTPGFVHAEDVDTEENDYIVRDPIRIDGNDDFAAQAAAEGWVGDGSEGDPYVIEGYEINGTGHGYGIYVGNTSVHFVVRGCYVHNVTLKNGTAEQESCIYLYYVRNGRFEDNTLNSKNGLTLHHSDYNIIDNNTIYGKVGLRLHYSNYNIIDNNTITTSSGILLWRAEYNIVSGNYIHRDVVKAGIPHWGISIFDSEHNIIKYNYISNYMFGITVQYDITMGVNHYINNTFVDVEYEIDEGVPVYNNNSNYPVLAYIGITIIITIIICLFLYKRRANKTNKGE